MHTSTKPAHEIVNARSANELYYRDGVDWPVGGDESLRGHGTIGLRHASQRVDIWAGPSVAALQFAAGWNMPGCLPDTPAELFDDIEEAWEYLADEVQLCADEMDQMLAEGIEVSIVEGPESIAEMDFTQPGSLVIGGLVYFVQRVESGQ